MKKESALPLLLTITLTVPALAEIHYLQENESVSELLYNRLKISPIYRGGLLKKVLNENGISQEKSLKLRTGTPIKIGEELPVAAEASAEPESQPEAVEPTVVPEETAAVVDPTTPKKYGSFVQLNAGMEYLSGNVEPSKFSSFYFNPQLKLGFEIEGSDYYQRLEASVIYVSFAKDKYMKGKNNFFNPGASYQLLKKFNSFHFGGKISADSAVQVVGSEAGDHYRLRNPLLLSAGPVLNWHGDKILGEFSVLYIPKQEVDSDNDLKYGLATQASFFKPITEKLKLGINLGYGLSEIEKTQIQRASASAAARYNF